LFRCLSKLQKFHSCSEACKRRGVSYAPSASTPGPPVCSPAENPRQTYAWFSAFGAVGFQTEQHRETRFLPLTHLVRGIGARNHPEIGETRAVYKVSGVVEIGLRRRPTASGELKIGMSRRSVSTAVRAIGVVELGARHRSDSTAVRARGVVATTLRKKNRNIIM
jgi:hypothetical protein